MSEGKRIALVQKALPQRDVSLHIRGIPEKKVGDKDNLSWTDFPWNPDNLSPSTPRLVQDLTIIQETLSKSNRQIRFVSLPATCAEVQKRLTKGCQMLHFALHGRDQYLGFVADEAERCGVLEPLSVSIMDNFDKSVVLLFSSFLKPLWGNTFQSYWIRPVTT